MAQPRVSVTDRFLKAWPMTARVVGLTIGVSEMVGSLFFARSPSAEVLAFAGGLLVAPNIAGVQDKRNESRDR